MKTAKTGKKVQEAHVSNTKYGMGDYYGTGIKQKMGTIRDGLGIVQTPPAKLRKPPKSLA